MRVSRYVPLLITASVSMASAAPTAECLSSASAVWAAHPGSHATWRLRLPGHEGTKCWFVRGSRDLSAPRVRQVADAARRAVYEEADRRTLEPTIRESNQLKPSAVDAPGESTARSTSHYQDTLLPTEHGPLSILVWAGRPMHIDSTWEDVFAARDRIGVTFATE
jgi:hypothetical protein